MRLDDGMPCVMGNLTLQFGAGVEYRATARSLGARATTSCRSFSSATMSISAGRRQLPSGDGSSSVIMYGLPGVRSLLAIRGTRSTRSHGAVRPTRRIRSATSSSRMTSGSPLGAMVMAGVRIGRGTVVAAGSVVTKDLPAYPRRPAACRPG